MQADRGRARGVDRFRPRAVGDDRAQMMLLTAFVLVIGFVVLSGMVARVTQLPEETRQSVDRPIYTESEAVARGVNDMLERLDELNAVDEEDPDLALYPGRLEELAADGAKHLERLESARGFRLKFVDDPECVVVDGKAVIRTTFALSDVQTKIQFTVSFEIPPAADGPTDDPDTAATPYTSC